MIKKESAITHMVHEIINPIPHVGAHYQIRWRHTGCSGLIHEIEGDCCLLDWGDAEKVKN